MDSEPVAVPVVPEADSAAVETAELVAEVAAYQAETVQVEPELFQRF